MRKLAILSFLIFSACASKERRPAAYVPEDGAISLDQALEIGVVGTTTYLKSKIAAKSFEGINVPDPAVVLPAAIRNERIPQVIVKEKQELSRFIRKYRTWSPARRQQRAEHFLSENFSCSDGIEAQSLALTLEIDFPQEAAMTSAQALHEKVLDCQLVTHQESLFKLTVFSIQKGECGKATEYLNKFPQDASRGVSDRQSYLRSFCNEGPVASERNPWGGYGILLGESAKTTAPGQASWYLGTKSGSEDWDRLLATFIELHEKKQTVAIKYLSGKINYEKLQALNVGFQTSLLVLMSFAGADLAVFQNLHKYLSTNPEMATESVAGLLFPVRYWDEIIENSKHADPILVKALIRQESAFNPAARSRAKAAGLMQLIYPTAKRFGIKKRQELLSPEANIQAGSEFLAQLIEEFGSVELALAAYNAGPGAVRQWQKRYPTKNVDLFVEMIPYTETREYVRLVRRNYKIYHSILVKQQMLSGTVSAAPNN